jgi:hypothetical protein
MSRSRRCRVLLFALGGILGAVAPRLAVAQEVQSVREKLTRLEAEVRQLRQLLARGEAGDAIAASAGQGVAIPASVVLGEGAVGGFTRTLNAEGELSTYVGLSNAGSPLIKLVNDDKDLVVLGQASAGGYVRTYNLSGASLAYLGNNNDGKGMLSITHGDRDTALVSQGRDGGYASLRNIEGEQLAFLGASNAGTGMLSIENAGKRLVVIAANSSGRGGGAWFYDLAGSQRAFIGVGSSGQGVVTVEGRQVADYAEVFELCDRDGISPGTVLSITDSRALGPSRDAYDRAVVGVASGAGDLHPGLVIGSRSDGSTDLPVAVSGQVYVRVSLEGGVIEAGDLLVASSAPGVAMRGASAEPPPGTVIGKALEGYSEMDGAEEGLVRMLVMMR